jgi:hypothetical protein
LRNRKDKKSGALGERREREKRTRLKKEIVMFLKGYLPKK